VNAAWESAANAQRHPYIVLSYDRAAPARAKDCVRACGLNQCSGACECRPSRLASLSTEPAHAEMTMARGVSAGGRPTCPEEPTFLFELAEQAVCRGREWQEKNPEAGVSATDSILCPYTIHHPMQPTLPGLFRIKPASGFAPTRRSLERCCL
jgi:hypothetical protein